MKNNTREIKFRVWDKNANFMWTEGGSWINDRYDNENFGSYPEVFLWALRDLRGNIDESFNPDPGDYILQQYVGIRDKNSKEIYEGDIITCSFFYSPETTITGVVEFSLETLNYVIRYSTVPDQEDGSGFTPQESLEDLHMVSDIEIIGNVFENGDITPGAARPC